MRTFLVETALVNSAARLLGITLIDNYAIFGAMPRYRHICLGKVEEADGIDNVPDKAESFRFGNHCGAVLEKYTKEWTDQEWLLGEAQVVRVFFAPVYRAEGLTTEQKKQSLLTIIQALVKRAQIRTHTAKPGYEDINTWLERYYRMQKEYRSYLPRLVDAAVEPGAESLRDMERFLSGHDGLIGLVLSDGFSGGEVNRELSREPVSIFGKMLKETLDAWKG